MSSQFDNEIVAIQQCKDGYAIVSNSKSIFYSNSVTLKEIIKHCKAIILYDASFLTSNHYLKSLYYHLYPDKNITSLRDIIKNEYYRTTTNDTTFLVKSKEAEKAVIEAKFMLHYYMGNYIKVNKKLLKSDNLLISTFNQAVFNTINIDQITLRTLLSEFNLKQWELERECWNKTKFPFISLSQLDKPSKQLIDDFTESRKIKNKFDSLSKYLDIDELILNFDFTNGATARITTKSQLGSFIPDKEFRNIFRCNSNENLLSFDYSKQEATILSVISEDKRLAKDLQHDNFYALLSKKFIGQANKEKGKILFYSLIYGAKSKTIASTLNIDIPQAIDIKEELENRYEKAYQWITEEAPELETNFYGRKIINPCANSYLQSTAADVVRQALYKTAECNPIIVFADEIIYKLPKNVDMLQNIKEVLEKSNPFNLKVLSKISTNLKF